jgi:hypothetical protein
MSRLLLTLPLNASPNSERQSREQGQIWKRSEEGNLLCSVNTSGRTSEGLIFPLVTHRPLLTLTDNWPVCSVLTTRRNRSYLLNAMQWKIILEVCTAGIGPWQERMCGSREYKESRRIESVAEQTRINPIKWNGTNRKGRGSYVYIAGPLKERASCDWDKFLKEWMHWHEGSASGTKRNDWWLWCDKPGRNTRCGKKQHMIVAKIGGLCDSDCVPFTGCYTRFQTLSGWLDSAASRMRLMVIVLQWSGTYHLNVSILMWCLNGLTHMYERTRWKLNGWNQLTS